VKEKRKGPISRAGGLVDSVAATVRRMQRDREPRVLAYDPTGYARLIQPEARGHERILEIGEEMVALAAAERRESGRATQAASEAATRPPAKAAKARPKPGTAGSKASAARSKASAAGSKASSAGSKARAAGSKSGTTGSKARKSGSKARAANRSGSSRSRKPKRAKPKEDT
jgi:hypothetical protein